VTSGSDSVRSTMCCGVRSAANWTGCVRCTDGVCPPTVSFRPTHIHRAGDAQIEQRRRRNAPAIRRPDVQGAPARHGT
jgi:hypothetical protein